MHVVGVMWSDWPQSVHRVGPGSSGPVQNHVRVFAAQVGRWESVSLQLPILACPSPVGHSSHPILASTKTCQGCSEGNKIPPSVKGMLHRWRDRQTYSCWISVLTVSNMWATSADVHSEVLPPCPCHQGKVWEVPCVGINRKADAEGLV